MNKNDFSFSIFLFFFIGFVCFFLLIFKFSDLFYVNFSKVYNVKCIFKNVGNLKIKSKVVVYGVKIGYVKNISLIRDNFMEYYVQVDIVIDVKFNFIPKDSVASIFMTSFFGDSYVQIELGNDSVFLKNNDIISLTNQAIIIEDLIAKFAFRN